MPEEMRTVQINPTPRKSRETGMWLFDFTIKAPITVHKPDFLNQYVESGIFSILFHYSDEEATYGSINTLIAADPEMYDSNPRVIRNLVQPIFHEGIKPAPMVELEGLTYQQMVDRYPN